MFNFIVKYKRYISIVLSAIVVLILIFIVGSKFLLSKNENLVINVVTADVQEGIETHIENKTKQGKGYFKFTSDNKEYSFKLVRIHTEYLANLGSGNYFACVDMVDTKGDLYDLDFFLKGKPGSMYVTETTLHKLNGIPYYTWQKNKQGVWERVPVKGALPELLGVKEGRDEFEFLYNVKLPRISNKALMWIPLSKTDEFQKVTLEKIKSPKKYRVLTDSKYGNKIAFFEFDSKDSNKIIDITYHVKRIEKSAYVSKTKDLKKYLVPNRLGPIDKKFKGIAEKVVANKKGELVRARALYDHVIDRISYIKHGKGWGKGDSVHACDVRSGNCTDFHAYFISLARAVGIPARFAIGAAIPSSRNNGGVDGYHCWAEFYAEGKWWPVDISEADKYSSLSSYYFGHHPANRFEFSQGRDIVVDPLPKSGLINFLAYPVLEVDGKTVKAKTKFYFKRS